MNLNASLVMITDCFRLNAFASIFVKVVILYMVEIHKDEIQLIWKDGALATTSN